jgi:transcriptional regulator with XRE-family HTH domain
MTTNRREDQLPDESGSYGGMLGYWMNVMGLSDGQLARLMGVDRSYPGKIRRGEKFPSPETADLIRKRLLETAEDPGWNGPHVLTVAEHRRMDELLRASYAREHTDRQQAKPLREPVKAREPQAMEKLMEELKLTKEDVARLRAALEHDETYSANGVPARPLNEGEAVPLDRGEDTGAVIGSAAGPPPSLTAIPAPALPGAQELEAYITLTGDDPSADEVVRACVNRAHLLALGKVDQEGLAHLLHCTVPVGTIVIPMLPVFTRMDLLMAAVQINPFWRELQAIEVEGSVLLGDLGSEEYLGINAWSGREFKLPASDEYLGPNPWSEREFELPAEDAGPARSRRFWFFRRKLPAPR